MTMRQSGGYCVRWTGGSLRGARESLSPLRSSSCGVACLSLSRILIVRRGAPTSSSIGMSDRRAPSLKRHLALIPATAGTTFFPWPLRVHSSRKPRKSCLAALYCVPAPSGCGSIASGLSPAIEAAMGGPGNGKDTTMATIGTFTSTGNGLGHALRSVL